MTRLFSAFILLGMLGQAPATSAEPAAQAPAATSTGQVPSEIQTEKTPVLGAIAFKKLAVARDYAEKKDFKTALRATERVRESRKSTDYERAMAWSIAAFCHYEMKQLDEAVAAYQQVLAQKDIPSGLRETTRYQIAQLYMANSNWPKAAEALEAWIAALKEPNVNAYTLLGQTYYQMKDYPRAQPALEKAVELAKSSGGKPKENLYLLLRAIHFADKDYNKLLEVLKLLVLDYPKKDYWMQLAAVYSELDQPKKQLAAMDYAYEQGLLTTSSEYVMLAQLMMANDVPYRAARALRSGIEKKVVEATPANYKLLADAWVMAKEYPNAIEALRVAAEHESGGEMNLRLAQLYMETGQWQQVVESSQAAIKKGDLKRPDVANIVSGLALYELNRLEDAAGAFDRAASDDRSKAMAEQWRSYIARERERRQALQSLSQG